MKLLVEMGWGIARGVLRRCWPKRVRRNLVHNGTKAPGGAGGETATRQLQAVAAFGVMVYPSVGSATLENSGTRQMLLSVARQRNCGLEILRTFWVMFATAAGNEDR